MKSQLVFKGYATRSLSDAAKRFKEQTGKEARAFVVQPGWVVYGQRRYRDLIVKSRFGGAKSIYVPLYLDKRQIEEIEAAKPVQRQATSDLGDLDELGEWVEAIPVERAYTRHCPYCGQMYETSPIDIRPHCGKYTCKAAYIEEKTTRSTIKKKYNRKPKEKAEEKQDLKPKPYSDDFSLDNPYAKTLRGHVYLIQARNGLCKIGRSDDVFKRFQALAAQNSESLELLKAVKCANYVRAEEFLHSEFASKRHHGEWFSLSNEDIDWIENLADGDLDGC